MMRILLADAAPHVDALIAGFLRVGWRVEPAPTASEALRRLATEAFDAAVLDVALPSDAGAPVAKAVRRLAPHRPLVITGRQASLDTKLELFELGIDDYVEKPYEPAELHARLKAICRRLGVHLSRQVGSIRLEYDPVTDDITCAGNPIILRPGERRLLQLLLANPQTAVSRQAIEQALFSQWAPPDTTADALVNRLREQLANQETNLQVCSVAGAGYMLMAA